MNQQEITQYLIEGKGWTKEEVDSLEVNLAELYELDKQAEAWFKKEIWNEVKE